MVKFDSLKKMNSSDLKKINFDNLQIKESGVMNLSNLQEKSVVNLAFYKKAVNKF